MKRKKFMNPFSNKEEMSPFRKMCWMLVLFPVLASGQQKIMLADAVKEGLVSNYSIRIARNSADIAKNNINYGKAGFLPSVSAYSSLDKASLDAKVRVQSGAKLDNKSASSTITNAGIKAQWVLFDGAGMFAEYEKLNSLWKLSDLETRMTMENTLCGIVVAYSDIIRMEQMLDAWRQRLNVSNFRYLIAKQKMNSGMGSEQELLQAGVLQQSDSTEYLKQVTAFQKSKILLNQLLAADIKRDFMTEDSIPLVVIPPVEELLSGALQNNINYLHAGEALQLSRVETKMLKAGLYPKVTLNGSYGYYKLESDAAFINHNRYFGPQVGVNVGINLFNGLQQRNQIRNARMGTESRELFLKELEQDISALILETHYDYLNHRQTILLARQGLNLAEKNLSIAKTAFQSGMISSLQLREAQEDLFHANASLVNAIFNAKVKETELLKYSGMLLK